MLIFENHYALLFIFLFSFHIVFAIGVKLERYMSKFTSPVCGPEWTKNPILIYLKKKSINPFIKAFFKNEFLKTHFNGLSFDICFTHFISKRKKIRENCWREKRRYLSQFLSDVGRKGTVT